MIAQRNPLYRLTRLSISFLLVVSMLFSPVLAANENASETSNAHKIRISFSQAVETSLRKSAQALDKATVSLFAALDKKDNISAKVHSHFYDARIRRYFVSVSGDALFTGKLPFKLESDNYLLSNNREISFDLALTGIKQNSNGISLKYDASIVVSMDRIAYRMMQTIPHFAASGALGPVFDMLGDFFEKLNIGILSQAVSDTLRSFSKVAFTKASTELLSQAGKNHNLGKLIHDTTKDGSIVSYLTLAIIKCASTSLVSVSGATLGSIVGSMVAPGPGSAVGAFIGSQVFTIVAKTVVHYMTAEIPLKINVKRMVNCWQITRQNPADEVARFNYDKAAGKISKKIANELESDKFSLFNSLLEEIEELPAGDRSAMAPLLGSLQDILSFKVTNDGDWYFARQYYQLKHSVEKWGLTLNQPR